VSPSQDQATDLLLRNNDLIFGDSLEIITIFHGQDADFLNVQAGGTYSSHYTYYLVYLEADAELKFYLKPFCKRCFNAHF
jgi:hypothetical protein